MRKISNVYKNAATLTNVLGKVKRKVFFVFIGVAVLEVGAAAVMDLARKRV